jgi:hypothetical protein
VAGFARFCPNESFVELKAQTYRFWNIFFNGTGTCNV